jgi:hypothetical protein
MKLAPRGELVDIGEVIQNATVFNLRNWQDKDQIMQDLPVAVGQLFALFEERQIEYVLVGGMAMLQYVEGRNTEDIDFIVDPEALDRIPEIEITGRQAEFARGLFAGVRVDFLFTSHRLFQLVRQRFSAIEKFRHGRIRCATVEGILLLKLFALPSLYRQGQFARVGIYENDIATLMQAYAPALPPLLQVLRPHLSDADMKSVSDILDEIQQRIRRFADGQKGRTQS